MSTPFENKTKPRLIGAAAGMALLGVLVAAAHATTATSPAPTTAASKYSSEPSVLVFDQKPTGDQINVDYANLPSNGYVVIYSSGADGKVAKDVVGHAELKAGDHRNFKVKLTSVPQPGSALWASIYVDADGKPGFDDKKDSSIWSSGIPSGNRFLIK